MPWTGGEQDTSARSGEASSIFGLLDAPTPRLLQAYSVIVPPPAAVAVVVKAFPKMAAVVRLRFFAGLSVEQTAEALEVSPTTVKRRWTWARAWLFREIDRDEERT